MKLLRADKNRFLFHLGRQEKQLLLQTLELYPLVPASHHRLSKAGGGPKEDENQRLLEESLAEQRRENQRQVQAMLNEPQRFRVVERGFELALTSAQVEWLLQVLNDVRVGSWLALGEPEPGEEPTANKSNAHFLLALELSGFFESALLAALGVRQSPQWAAE